MAVYFIIRDILALASVCAFVAAASIWGDQILNATGGL